MKMQLKNKTSKVETGKTERKKPHKIPFLSKIINSLSSEEKTKIEHHEDKTNGNMRSLGIKVIDKIPWGTHLCQFYQTKKDLIDILVPYFKVGLENNELCMWITSEPLRVEEAKISLEKEVDNLDEYIKRGQIEILDYTEWYTKSGKFDADKVLESWVEKENHALNKGFDGVRLTGNTSWLELKDWKDFADYEASIDSAIGKYRMIAICSYYLHKCGASEVIDVVSNHQFSLIRKKDKWEIIESAEHRRAEEEIKNLDKFPSEDPNPVLRIAEDGKILYANEASLPLLDKWDTKVGGSVPDDWYRLIIEVLYFKQSRVREYRLENKVFSFMIAPILNGRHYVNVYGMNITELKGKEEALKKSEERLELAVKGSSDGLWDWPDVRHDRLWWSPQVYELTGYKWSEIEATFSNFEKFLHPDDKERVIKAIHVHFEKRVPFDIEFRLQTKSGEYRWFRSRAKTKWDGRGHPIRMAGSIQDINDRKNAEEELKKYRSHLEELVRERTSELTLANNQLQKQALIIDQIHDSVISTDLDGYTTNWNKGGERIFGYTEKEALGKHISFVYPKEEHEFLEQKVISPLKQKGIHDIEVRLRRKTGEEFYAHLSLSLLRNSMGEVIGMIGYTMDITEKKQAEEKLKAEQQRLFALLEGLPVFVCLISSNHSIRFANRYFRKHFGDPEGRLCYEVLVHRNEPCKECPTFRIFDTQEPQYWEAISPNGNAYEISDYPFIDIDGSLLVLELGIDITKRKQTEEALRASEKKYSTLVEQANDGVCILQDEVFAYANDVTAEILGYQVEELIGKSLTDILVPEYKNQNVQRLRARLVGKEVPTRYENKCICKDGTIKDVELSLSVIEYKKKPAVMVIVHDITERKKAEKALQESEAKYRNLMENASDAIVIVDDEGNLLQVNKKAEKLLGYNSKELINMNIAQIHPKEDLERTFRAFKEIQSKGEGGLTNGFVLRKDGKKILVDITGNVINYGDKKIIQEIFRDITERKRIEEELQKIEKLESIGVLAGGIAHDFNNLLTGIIGNLSLAELYTKPEDDIFETLQRAKKASKRAGQLTKQLLTFSKGGAPIKQTSSIFELVEDTTSFALRGAKVKCEFSLPNNLWPVEIDKGQISQMIHNLIINADHAMPDGGIITISAENKIINGNNSLPLKTGRYIKVSVKDQGIGIPREHLDKIFDPYFTTKKNGSGLGLASCFSIAKSHGGYITVESEIGAGTSFDIYLPVSNKGVFEVKEIIEEKIFPGKGTILFMDDEDEVINTAQQMSVQLGYEIKIAKTGNETINMYKRAKESGEPFDLVILDLTIPGDMGGKETIKRLLQIDPDVKAIASSGYSNNPIMAEYKDYGFKGVVAKPYEIQQLSEILYRVLNGKEEEETVFT